MKHLTTLTDKNYIINGLCLYDSLKAKTSTKFTLHYLCTDEYTFDKLKSLHLEDIVPYTLGDLMVDKEFETLSQNNACRPINEHAGLSGEDQSDFHFALASFFSYFLIHQHNLSHSLYIDSDILFYSGVEKIFDSVGNKSIGLITHKHIRMDKVHRNPGYYNVGVIYFKNSDVGKACLKFWRDCCIYPNNQFSDIFGACGDQKYLELFDEFFDKEEIKIIDHDVGHGAPWNFVLFDFLSPTRVVWKDPCHLVLDQDSIEQDTVFNHFSHFTPDYINDTYKYDRGYEWGPRLREHPGVKEVYDDYFEKLKETRERYNLL